METKRVRALRGPNLWSRATALEAIVSIEAGERKISDIQGFEARLVASLPGLSLPVPNGNPTEVGLAHALERAALALQVLAGCPVSFSRTHPTVEPGTFLVVVEYSVEEVGRLAFELAETAVRAAVDGSPFDRAGAAERIQALDEEIRLGPSTGSIVRAALARSIPVRRLNDQSLVQFGWGARQRRIQAAETDRTSAIAESIAQDKELTKTLLAAAGVPVPEGLTVSSPDEAWAAAREIGLPVVVKPRCGNQGKGVAVNLSTREAVAAAYAVAEHVAPPVMVERFVPGRDFRLLVVGGKLVAAARREPPQVTGDGTRTVRDLVDEVNSDPRRRDGHATSLSRIRLDDIAVAVLADQGLAPDSVPPAGTVVALRRNANLSTGGTATDVTDDVHPDVAARAVDAARMVGLDICGVDVVCRRIDRPLADQAGAVVEVNAAPGFRMHLDPSYGKGRPVGEAVISTLYPSGDDGRIPVVSVAGTNGKTTTVRLIAHLLKTRGDRVGMTCSDGIYLDGRRVETGDCSGPKSARSVLLNPRVDSAVFETARGGILREGLAFDRCDVAVVTNIGTGDHLGLSFITTVEDLAVVKRVIVQNVSPTGMAVLNAADPHTAAMASSCPGSVTFFARSADAPVLAAHRSRGGRVVFQDGEAIVAAEGGREQRIALSDVPLTRNGTVGFQVENAVAAVGAAWGLNLAWDAIRAGLATFVNDPRTAPGRFNVMDYRGATLIADYGHNPDAIAALVAAIDRMPARRRVIVISAAGDRRDADIRRQGELIGDAFDDIVLYQDQCQRGRSDGEVLALLREGLGCARRASWTTEIRGEFLAIDAGLARLGPGDVALVLIDQVEESLAYLEKVTREAAGVTPAQPPGVPRTASCR
jgi:cyanophycin synthetase